MSRRVQNGEKLNSALKRKPTVMEVARFDRSEFIKAMPIRFAKAYQAKYGIVEYRTRQAEFRKRIFEKYNGRCPISGCDEASALEAAHLGAKGGWRTNHTEGILLRRDLHAFERGITMSLIKTGSIKFPLTKIPALAEVLEMDAAMLLVTLMATSNSPACGQSNSPRQDG